MRRPRVLPIVIAAACVLSACSGGGSGSTGDDAGQYASDATFNWAIKDDLGAFDPYHSQTLSLYAYLAYDPLVNLQPDGEFASGLAEKWQVDPSTATFTLRSGVTCSDGTVLTATQVAAAIQYVADPKNKSALYGVNVPTVPLTATGDDAARTVTVRVSKPFGLLLHTVGRLPVVCPKGLKNPGMLKDGSDGTGPFVLSKYVPGQSYTFTRRKDYAWGPDGAATSAPGMPATVVLHRIENETTAANLLLSGEVNLVGINGDDRGRLSESGLTKVETAGPGAWLRLNHATDRPTSDVRVRKALVHALNRDEVVKVNTGGSGKAAAGLVSREPKPCPGDTIAGRLPEHDPAAAERLLDEAGWAKGADGKRSKNGKPLLLDLHYVPPNSPLDKPTAELVAQQWRAVGIDVRLTADTYASLNTVWFESGDFDVYLFGSGFALPSQQVPYLSGPLPPTGVNFTGIANPGYDSAVAKALALTPPEACKHWDEAEHALFANVDVAPIAERPWAYFMKKASADMIIFAAVPTSLRVLK
jgi:peptide/nickel transport system substrate-binding protein